MLDTDTGEPVPPDESFEFLIESVEDSEMPSWVTTEMQKLWNNPDDFEEGETLNERLTDDERYLLFRLGIGFGIEYERKYPTDGDWRDDEEES